MERAERIQESLAARLMQQHEQRRQEVARQVLRAGNARLDALTLIEENVIDPRYYTPRTCFREFCEAFGKKVHGAEEEILVLMHRLRKPEDRAGKPRNVAPNPASQVPSPVSRVPWPGPDDEAVPSVTSLDPSPVSPIPNPAPEDKAVPPVTLLDPSPVSRIPSPESRVPNPDPAPDEDTYLMELEELDADDFPVPWPTIAVAEGAERDELREELWELVREHQKIVQTALDSELQEHEAPLSRLDQDEVLAAPHRHAELMRREEESCFRQFMRLGNLLMKFQDHAAKQVENEGPSGYVDENPGGGETDPMTNCLEPVAAGTEDVIETGPSAGSEVGGTASESRSPESEAQRGEAATKMCHGHLGRAPSRAGRPWHAAHGRRPDYGFKIPDKPSPEVENARSEVLIGGSTSNITNHPFTKSLNPAMIR